jgi:toxin ParE1/3/4
VAQVRKREAAKRDLLAQWVWYAENAGVETADRFLAAVESTVLNLAQHPNSGIPVVSNRRVLQDMRRFPVHDGFERILLFYVPIENGIDLVRVVHGSRDIGRLLAEGLFG